MIKWTRVYNGIWNKSSLKSKWTERRKNFSRQNKRLKKQTCLEMPIIVVLVVVVLLLVLVLLVFVHA